METRRKKQTQIQTNAFDKTSGGCVIAVRNNSFIDSELAFFRAYIVTNLKVLDQTFICANTSYFLILKVWRAL